MESKAYNKSELRVFRLNTGNINSCGELKRRACKDSAEELVAALQIELNKRDDLHFANDQTISLAAMETNNYPRNDLKITLKVFMSSSDFSQVTDCLNATKSLLGVESIEQLIMSFNNFEPESEDSEDKELKNWVENVISVWEKIEALVKNGEISTVGVADFDLNHLKALYDGAEIKPRIAHFNIAGCCSVPKDLQDYARENDIQLLTHNDPKPFVTADGLKDICNNEKYPLCDHDYKPSWASRYTVWVRGRSIIAAKGYMVQFERS
uniref:GCS light chain n=2 Tax=Ascaris TaxID=6251 RepID=F1L958_ASCSU